MCDLSLMVCGFSGGIASAYMSYLINKECPNRTVLLYHSTNTEPDDNDRFRQEVSSYIGIPITEYSDGRDIWTLFRDEGFLGNDRVPLCSRILKAQMNEKWLTQNAPDGIKCIGYTAEETARAQRMTMRANDAGIKVRFPLIERKIYKPECWRVVTKCWGIKPPEMYKWADHANCVPCIRGSTAYWGMVYINARDAWEKAAAEEDYHGHQILSESKGLGTLREELQRCIKDAHRYMKERRRKEAKRAGGFAKLLEAPCHCNT